MAGQARTEGLRGQGYSGKSAFLQRLRCKVGRGAGVSAAGADRYRKAEADAIAWRAQTSAGL